MNTKLMMRPHAEHNESAIGYLIRLAKANLFDSLPQFFRTLGLKKPPTAYRNQNLKTFADLTIELGVESNPTLYENMLGTFSEEAIYGSYQSFAVSKKPIICPQCIKEDGYHRKEWQYTPYSFCKKHKCSHINICGGCNRELEWNVLLLEGVCQHCYAKLWSPSEKNLPLHIRRLDSIQSNSDGFIAMLLETARKLMRPCDLMDKRISTSPIMQADWNNLYTLAGSYIASGKKVPSSLDIFSSGAEQDYMDFCRSGIASGVRQATKVLPTSSECRYLVDPASIGKLLGLTELQLSHVIAECVFPPKFKKPYCGTFLYDFREVNKRIQNLKALENEGEPISKLEDEAATFWCKKTDILDGIFKGAIGCQFANLEKPKFDELLVSVSDTHRFYLKRRSLKKEVLVNVGDAARIMGIKGKDVRKLVKANLLRNMTPNNGDYQICVDSMIDYMKSHLTEKRKIALNRGGLKIPIFD